LTFISFYPLQSALGKYIEQQPTLLEEYHLRNKSERNPATYVYSHGFTENSHFPEEEVTLESYILFCRPFIYDLKHT